MKCPNCGSIDSGYGNWAVGGCKACGIMGGIKRARRKTDTEGEELRYEIPIKSNRRKK